MSLQLSLHRFSIRYVSRFLTSTPIKHVHQRKSLKHIKWKFVLCFLWLRRPQRVTLHIMAIENGGGIFGCSCDTIEGSKSKWPWLWRQNWPINSTRIVLSDCKGPNCYKCWEVESPGNLLSSGRKIIVMAFWFATHASFRS